MIVEGRDVTPDDWDMLVHASPDGWPFALSGWRRMILSVAEWELEDHSFALADRNGLVAVVPLQLDRRSGAFGITGWGGCGPIVAERFSGSARGAVMDKVFDHIDQIARRTGAQALRFWLPTVTRSAFMRYERSYEFGNWGFSDRSSVAQVIDLSPDEVTLRGAVSETARQTIRKAERAGITVAQEPWPDMVDAYYETHRENYIRTGVTPHPRRYFEGIAIEMAPLRYSVLWVARDRDGVPIAFHNDMQFGEGVWYHTGCSTTAALRNGANYLLFWCAMLGAKAAGRRWYDCGEIFPNADDSKQRGLTLFKTRFGGAPRRFVKAEKIYRGSAGRTVRAIHRLKQLLGFARG
jgi:hypothetical protein